VRFHLVAVGTRQPDWIRAGFDDYARRLFGGARLELHEIAAARRADDSAAAGERARADEARRLRAAVPRSARLVALDGGGRALDSAAIAERMAEWRRTGTRVAFLVGGPDGLAGELLAAADERWSLSALTLPHGLVRIVIAEQIYRGLSILHNQPYHR